MKSISFNDQESSNQIARPRLDKRIFLVLIPVIILISILALYSSASIIRLIAGIPLIFVLPGFLLILALKPSNSDLEPIRSLALIIPTSVAIVGILLLVVNYFFTYKYEPVVVALASLEIVLTVIAFFRPSSSSSSTEPFSRFSKLRITTTLQDLKIGHIFLGISILIFVTSIAYTTVTPRQSRDITEFFLVEPGGYIDNQLLTVNQKVPFNLVLAVHNLESMDHEYYIDVWGVRQFGEERDFITSIEGFNLDKNEKRRLSFPLIMTSAGSNQGVEILLYIDEEPDPYRRIYLNLDVKD